jgi:hypothetical protein
MGHFGRLDESGVKRPSLAYFFQEPFSFPSQGDNRQPFLVPTAPEGSGSNQVPVKEWPAVLAHSRGVVLVAELFQVTVRYPVTRT